MYFLTAEFTLPKYLRVQKHSFMHPLTSRYVAAEDEEEEGSPPPKANAKKSSSSLRETLTFMGTASRAESFGVLSVASIAVE